MNAIDLHARWIGVFCGKNAVGFAKRSLSEAQRRRDLRECYLKGALNTP